ncbi:MAG: thiamine biosynthesis protein ThiS [Bacteroidetes bacterium HGW-Bacteroidetes-21]|nr:MAG: thiamine biosynthesis protein ThiS [Bacteroidetes bacterium HGW-Bacteroidetes-21]
MKIILNNNVEEFEGDKLSVSRIMEIKKFTFKMLVVKLNGAIVYKNDFDTTLVQDGDNLTILHLISGG